MSFWQTSVKSLWLVDIISFNYRSVGEHYDVAITEMWGGGIASSSSKAEDQEEKHISIFSRDNFQKSCRYSEIFWTGGYKSYYRPPKPHGGEVFLLWHSFLPASVDIWFLVSHPILSRSRIIWLVVILLCCAGIGYTCAYQWNRYEANPTVISLERDYRHWNGTLPSVTLCYTIKIDPTKADDYIRRFFTLTHAVWDNCNLFVSPWIELGILLRAMTTTAILWISSNQWQI